MPHKPSWSVPLDLGCSSLLTNVADRGITGRAIEQSDGEDQKTNIWAWRVNNPTFGVWGDEKVFILRGRPVARHAQDAKVLGYQTYDTPRYVPMYLEMS